MIVETQPIIVCIINNGLSCSVKLINQSDGGEAHEGKKKPKEANTLTAHQRQHHTEEFIGTTHPSPILWREREEKDASVTQFPLPPSPLCSCKLAYFRRLTPKSPFIRPDKL